MPTKKDFIQVLMSFITCIVILYLINKLKFDENYNTIIYYDKNSIKDESFNEHIKYVNDDSIFYIDNGDTIVIMNYWAIKRLDSLMSKDTCNKIEFIDEEYYKL